MGFDAWLEAVAKLELLRVLIRNESKDNLMEGVAVSYTLVDAKYSRAFLNPSFPNPLQIVPQRIQTLLGENQAESQFCVCALHSIQSQNAESHRSRGLVCQDSKVQYRHCRYQSQGRPRISKRHFARLRSLSPSLRLSRIQNGEAPLHWPKIQPRSLMAQKVRLRA